MPAKKDTAGFMASLSAPAQRALKNNGIATLKKLAKYSEKDILALHGMGPASLPILRASLKTEGLSFLAAAKSPDSRKSPKAAPPKSSSVKSSSSKMKMKNIDADTPAEYLAALSGWREAFVKTLRKSVLGAVPKALEERIKWGHLVYFHNGPVLLIRAEDARVLFGLWRGKRLREIEPRFKAGGKYEMATLELREGDKLPSTVTIKALVKAAVELNRTYGDPQTAAK